jgi:phage regulator Rha-like protein
MIAKKKEVVVPLVEVHGQKILTTSLIIANNCKVKHDATIKLVRKFENDLKEVGRVGFQIRPFMTAGGEQKQEIAELDDYAAMLLLTHMRSNDVVREFKKSLVQEFKHMRQILTEPDREPAIADKRLSHGFMMDALVYKRDSVGKDTTANHFTNENLFCNRALTGQWEPLDESTLDAYDLRLLSAIRAHNIFLLSKNLKQQDRKEEMDDFVKKYRTKKPRLQLVINHANA